MHVPQLFWLNGTMAPNVFLLRRSTFYPYPCPLGDPLARQLTLLYLMSWSLRWNRLQIRKCRRWTLNSSAMKQLVKVKVQTAQASCIISRCSPSSWITARKSSPERRCWRPFGWTWTSTMKSWHHPRKQLIEATLMNGQTKQSSAFALLAATFVTWRRRKQHLSTPSWTY